MTLSHDTPSNHQLVVVRNKEGKFKCLWCPSSTGCEVLADVAINCTVLCFYQIFLKTKKAAANLTGIIGFRAQASRRVLMIVVPRAWLGNKINKQITTG